MGRIQLLPETLANQIAAGEVIERPAAVVKELVENALDAGARRIEIDLSEGGRRLIRVRDDGSGMPREDAELSLQRHATSKLRTKDDLFAIASYGFRGEALPSMAAVSRFTLLTGEPAAMKGTRIEVDGGRVERVEDAGAPPGTTVEVRDLFWNVPARRKFLKRAAAEQAQCVDAVLRIAIPRPDVAFVVREEGRKLLDLHAGPGVLAHRAEEALGRDVRGQLVEFQAEVRGVRAHGVAVSPEVDFGSARNVWLFVNGRAIRDRSLTHAVLRAFGEVIPHGRYPGALVFLELPASEVDVNVHPAKAEVRLADARAAWEAIHSGLVAVLARGQWLKPQQTPQQERVAEAIQSYVARPHAAEPFRPQPQLVTPAPFFAGLRYLGQLHRSYLVCEGPQGLVLIDQHAAHERMNYQRIRQRRGQIQPMLVPIVVQLSAAAAAGIAEQAQVLRSLGFDLEVFDGNSIAVKALPQGLDAKNLAALLTDLSEELAQHGRGESLERLQDALAARAACHASVRAHDGLAPGEAQSLLDALDATDYGARCAHGRPVVFEMGIGEVEKRFGRDYMSHPHVPSKATE